MNSSAELFSHAMLLFSAVKIRLVKLSLSDAVEILVFNAGAVAGHCCQSLLWDDIVEHCCDTHLSKAAFERGGKSQFSKSVCPSLLSNDAVNRYGRKLMSISAVEI